MWRAKRKEGGAAARRGRRACRPSSAPSFLLYLVILLSIAFQTRTLPETGVVADRLSLSPAKWCNVAVVGVAGRLTASARRAFRGLAAVFGARCSLSCGGICHNISYGLCYIYLSCGRKNGREPCWQVFALLNCAAFRSAYYSALTMTISSSNIFSLLSLPRRDDCWHAQTW